MFLNYPKTADRVTSKTNKYVDTHICYILEGEQIIVKKKKAKAKKIKLWHRVKALIHNKADLLSVFVNNVLLEHSHNHLRKKLLPVFRFIFLQHGWIIAEKTTWSSSPIAYTLASY